MSYSNIKRALSVALLIAFTAPSTLALSPYDSEAVSYESPYVGSMLLYRKMLNQ